MSNTAHHPESEADNVPIGGTRNGDNLLFLTGDSTFRRKSRGNPLGINKPWQCAFIPMGGPQAHGKIRTRSTMGGGNRLMEASIQWAKRIMREIDNHLKY